MKKQYRHLVVVLTLLPGLVAFEALGQSNERFGTSALSELTVPVTPRTIALGSTLTGGMNGASGVEALISNPAAILVNPSTTAMFSRMNYRGGCGRQLLRGGSAVRIKQHWAYCHELGLRRYP